MDDVDAKIGGDVFQRLTVGRSAVVMVGGGLHSRHTSRGRGNCACHRETFDRTIQKPRQGVVWCPVHDGAHDALESAQTPSDRRVDLAVPPGQSRSATSLVNTV